MKSGVPLDIEPQLPPEQKSISVPQGRPWVGCEGLSQGSDYFTQR
jgi:hypothetical protein